MLISSEGKVYNKDLCQNSEFPIDAILHSMSVAKGWCQRHEIARVSSKGKTYGLSYLLHNYFQIDQKYSPSIDDQWHETTDQEIIAALMEFQTGKITNISKKVPLILREAFHHREDGRPEIILHPMWAPGVQLTITATVISDESGSKPTVAFAFERIWDMRNFQPPEKQLVAAYAT